MTRTLCARLMLLLAVALAALTVTGAAAAAAPTYVSGAGMIGGAGFDWLWPGHVLTAQAGVWNGEPDAFSYRWSRGGTFVGAGPQYTVTNADVGSQIMLSITASKGADLSAPVDVLSDTVRWPLPESTRPAAIKGTVVAGATVTAHPAMVSDESGAAGASQLHLLVGPGRNRGANAQLGYQRHAPGRLRRQKP